MVNASIVDTNGNWLYNAVGLNGFNVGDYFQKEGITYKVRRRMFLAGKMEWIITVKDMTPGKIKIETLKPRKRFTK